MADSVDRERRSNETVEEVTMSEEERDDREKERHRSDGSGTVSLEDDERGVRDGVHNETMEDIPVNGEGGEHRETMEDIPMDDEETDDRRTEGDRRGSSGGSSTGGISTNSKPHPDIEELSGNIVLNKNIDISERMQNIKNWGLNTFMRTKQKVKEKLNRTSRTIDNTLEDRIEALKLQKTQYSMMVANNNRTIEQLKQMIYVHQYTARMASEISQIEKTLNQNFLQQSQIELASIAIIKELISKLACSNETLETLVGKTYDDLLKTIEIYNNARVEFDAYKTETVRLVSQIQQKNDSNPNDQIRFKDMQENLELRRKRYESQKDSVQVKIDLLEDHKTRVIQRELMNCRNAWFNYYSQCSSLLSDTNSKLSELPRASEAKESEAPTEN